MRLKESVRQINLLSLFFLLNLNFVISTRIAKLAPVLNRKNSIRIQGIFFSVWNPVYFLEIFCNYLQSLNFYLVPVILCNLYTVKKISEIFPKIVGQLKIRIGHKFFRIYSRKYFRHRTGNSSYCLVREISSLIGNLSNVSNLSGKRSKKSEQISAFHGKNFLQLKSFVKCSHLFDIFSNNSEISPKIRTIFLKSMKYFHFLQENLCFLRV